MGKCGMQTEKSQMFSGFLTENDWNAIVDDDWNPDWVQALEDLAQQGKCSSSIWEQWLKF